MASSYLLSQVHIPSLESTNEPLGSDIYRHEPNTLSDMIIDKQELRVWRSFFYGICNSEECFKCSNQLDSPLKKCSGCQLVYYCSRECQKKDWSSHKNWCKTNAIKPDGRNIFGAAKGEVMNCKAWSTYRDQILKYNRSVLKRNMNSYEEETVIYPRVCIVCMESDPTHLTDCKNCYSVAYCSEEHKLKDEENHKGVCYFLNLTIKCYAITREFGYLCCSLPLEMPEVFQSLQNKTLCNKIPKSTPDMIDLDVLGCLMSDVITYPLSIIYALENVAVKLGSQEQTISKVRELTVHLVGSRFYTEILGINKWEYFMHQLPALTKLTIVFVGPELWGHRYKNYRHEGKLRCCEVCQEKGRQVLYEESQTLYHEYVTHDYYKHPDVIVAFNCGFNFAAGEPLDTWPESIVEMTKDNTVPLIFTSYFRSDSKQDLQAVKYVSEVDTLLDVSKNPFSSLYPMRNLCDHENCHDNKMYICFSNSYITVVRGKKQENNQ